MAEKLPKGIRIHNRREKAAARRERRQPDLIRPVGYGKREEQAPPPQITNNFEYQTSVTIQTLDAIDKERIVRKQRRQPTTFNELWTAASDLSMMYREYEPETKEPHRYISDREAVGILESLTDGVESGQISTHQEIGKEVYRLRSLMGAFGVHQLK